MTRMIEVELTCKHCLFISKDGVLDLWRFSGQPGSETIKSQATNHDIYTITREKDEFIVYDLRKMTRMIGPVLPLPSFTTPNLNAAIAYCQMKG